MTQADNAAGVGSGPDRIRRICYVYFRHLAARVERAARSVDRGAALDQAVPVRQQHRPPRPAPDRQPESLHRIPHRRLGLRPPSRA